MAIKKVGKYWQIDYYEPSGKRKRQNFKKKKDAVAELGKREALKVEGRYLDVKKEYTTTLREALNLYEQNFDSQPSFKTAKQIFIRQYKEYFGKDKLLVYIRYRDLEAYRTHLQQALTHHKKVRSAASINRQMSCLRHIFKKAVEWELIDENPFTRGSSLHLKENNQRIRYLTEEEIPRLLDACATKVIKFPNSKNHVKQMTRKDSDYMRDIVECAIYTGMRKGELLSLKWEQIRGDFIYLRKTKTSNPRQTPINDDLEALFKRIRKRQGLNPNTFLPIRASAWIA